MGAPKTISVLGVPLAVTDYAGAVAQVKQWGAGSTRPYAVAAANTHVVALARHDPQFAEVMGCFDLLLPDGMPLLWVMNRRLAVPLRERVYGPTFMLRCLEATQGAPWTHYFIGGSPDLLVKLEASLIEKFPGLRITGSYSPPFDSWPAGEDERIAALVRESGAKFVWIGLGCPKQEKWIARCRAILPPAVYCAVGAAFAFHAGQVRQAPRWMQQAGLEWLFRLVVEPRRLWRRYLVYNSLFLIYLWRESFRRPSAGS